MPRSAAHKQARIHQEVLEYAAAMAGTAHDLDTIVEAASLEVVALCHQITTLDRGKLGELVGTLDPQWMHEMEEGVKIALDLR